MKNNSPNCVRKQLQIGGAVQGIGFRPYLFNLAKAHALAGFVRNSGGCVTLDVQGGIDDVDAFIEHLTKVRTLGFGNLSILSICDLAISHGGSFFIDESDSAGTVTNVPSDMALCRKCIGELEGGQLRRGSFLINSCSQCGPRFSIVRSLPFDRAQTSQSIFEPCADCRHEYASENDRRFHSQLISCEHCGPSYQFVDHLTGKTSKENIIESACRLLAAGAIIALKGVGGFHLLADATNEKAVQSLRDRKQRPDKPLAIMVHSIGVAQRYATVQESDITLMQSTASPIVVVPKLPGALLADNIAPSQNTLGIMLPYTALHYLLTKSFSSPIAITSANMSGGTLEYENASAMRHLSGLADNFLLHDRDIVMPCDDSVVKTCDKFNIKIRRSRGYVPLPLHLPIQLKSPMLATGAYDKITFALGLGSSAILSQHLAKLSTPESYGEYDRAIRHFFSLYNTIPQFIVHDKHPDYGTTRWAHEYVQERNIQLMAVQHHHAHMASCMAENQLEGATIGVIFDGTGLGDDGKTWGGEFLVGDYASVKRTGHFRYVRMPGAEQAIWQPWRMAMAYLHDAGCLQRTLLPDQALTGYEQLNAILDSTTFPIPLTSSCGRLFDAVSVLLLGVHEITYDGQAAQMLESSAHECSEDASSLEAYPFDVEGGAPFHVDFRSTIAAIVDDMMAQTATSTMAFKFHLTLASVIRRACEKIAAATGIYQIVMSGGVFTNGILLEQAYNLLRDADFKVYFHQHLPANDGGISFGQLAVAAGQME